MTKVRAGEAHRRYDREAAQLVCDVADQIEPPVVFEITAAMWLFQETNGSRIKSDHAFRSLLVHPLRRECGAGGLWSKPKWRPGLRIEDVHAGRQKVTYQLLSKKAREGAAMYVLESIGGAALGVATKELERLTAKRERDEAYMDAVRSIV